MNYLKRFKNVGTIVSLVGLIGMLALQFGINIDLVWLDNVIKLICSIGVILGIFNNPTTNGMDFITREELENIWKTKKHN